MREEEEGRTISIPAEHLPATRVVGKSMVKFPPISFPSRTASASVIEPYIIFWMSPMSVPRSLDDSSTSDDSPPKADSVEHEREIEERLRSGSI